MKIAIISDKYPPKILGGAAVIAMVHAKAMSDAGHEVIVITTTDDKKDIGIFFDNKIKIIKLYSKYHARYRSYLSLFNPLICIKLISTLLKEKVDIISMHNIHYHFSFFITIIARFMSRASFITLHDAMAFNNGKLYPEFPFEELKNSYKVKWFKQLKDHKFRFNPIRNLLIKILLKFPNKIFAVSNSLKLALEQNNIKNIEVIYNGIDTKLWIKNQKNTDEFIEKFNLKNKKIILFCGSLNNAKGGKKILLAMNKITEEIPDALLVILGNMDNQAVNMIKEAGLINNNSIKFIGRLDRQEIINAYSASHVVVVPSLCYDWFPTVNLEAMIMSVPVISSCYGGSREVVHDDKGGYIINPYNTEILAEKIISILNNKDKSIKMGKYDKDLITKEFNIEKFAQKYIYWYNSFIK